MTFLLRKSIGVPVWVYLFSAAYLLLIFYLEQRLARAAARRVRAALAAAQKDRAAAAARLDELDRQCRRFDEEAGQIFVLYELTKELTRNFDEETAFRVFQEKLRFQVPCRSCRIFPADSDELEAAKADTSWHFVALAAHQQTLGYLGVQGCGPEDRHKVAVLAQQLALALQRLRLYREVEQLAITDSLTGVYTRRHVLERFAEEVRRGRSRKSTVSFMMADIDFFKHFNDQYGHLTGDLILRRVAGLIKENIREIDFLGRYGGEEFCVVLPDTASGQAFIVAERVRQAVARSVIKAYDIHVRLTLSIGIATFPFDGQGAEEMIREADAALYKAKAAGRNVCVAAGGGGSDSRLPLP